jgi:hypothetical protein
MQLSPLQLQILRLLEEAGEENIPTIANTIRAEAAPDAGPDVLGQIDAALRALHEADLVGFAYYRGDHDPAWQPLTDARLRVVFPIHRCLEWHGASGGWRWREDRCGRERVIVTLEDQGKRLIKASS